MRGVENVFTDREEAGKRLAAELRERGVTADVVLAIPRGGLPLGRPVADALDRPLDVIVARKIGAPGNPEFAIGAVAADGSAWLNEDAIRRAGVGDEYVERERDEQTEAAAAKAERYRTGAPPDLDGKSVLVVDDGVATGATAIACIRMAYERGADRVVLAVPVGPPQTVSRLQEVADDVVCLDEPRSFRAVGQFYENFSQVTDEEAIGYLST